MHAGEKWTVHRSDVMLLLLLFVVAWLLRLSYILLTNFDGLYGQDAFAYYDFAHQLRAALHQGQRLGNFFWPLGYPVLLALGFTFLGDHATAGQGINLVLGSTLAPLLFVLARQHNLSRFGAFTTGLLMLVCGQAVQSSLVLMSDIPALTWAVISTIALTHYLNQPSPPHPTVDKYLLIAAVTLMLALITRWIYVLLVIPSFLMFLVHTRGRIRWRTQVGVAAAITAILLPQILYSRTNPAPTLNHPWVENWSPVNIARQSFTNVEGYFEFTQINAVFYARPFYDPYYLSPLFTLFLFPGLIGLIRGNLQSGSLIAAWLVLCYLFLAGIPAQNIRFALVFFPPAALAAAAGIDYFVQRFKGHQRHILIRMILLIIIIAGVTQTLMATNTTIQGFINQQQKDRRAVRWADSVVPVGETIYTFGLTLMLRHDTDLTVYELYDETPESLVAKWQSGRIDYLLVNVWNIEHQWSDRSPQIAYHWLRDERGLIRLGQYGNYTLYRIRG